MRIAASILLLGFALASATSAREIYVNNLSGDDLFDGTAPTSGVQGGGPCRTIKRALQLARKSDRIILVDTGEPYRESITLQGGRNSGTTSFPFVIEGNGAVLDGSQPVPKKAWEHFAGDLFRFRPPRSAYQQLFLDDRPAMRREVDAGGQLPDLQPLEWCLLDTYVYFCVEENRLPQDYALAHSALTVGITLYEVRNSVISDLYVQGFQLDGINAHDSAFDATLLGVVCQGNGRSGISVGGASRVRIEACLVHYNGEAQVRTEGFSETHVVNSELAEDLAPAVASDGGEVFVEDGDGD